MTKLSNCALAAFVALELVTSQAATLAAELPSSAVILDDDLVTWLRPTPTVSPDGELVAYVSRGFVCVADLKTGQSRRLKEVPETWTHVFATEARPGKGGNADTLIGTLAPEKRQELQGLVTQELVGLQWLADSSGVVFDLRSYDRQRKQSVSHVWRVPLEGEPIEIAHSDPTGRYKTSPSLGLLTRDGRYIVSVADHGSRSKAAIWDVATGKPKAAPFMYLTPSPTSGRWLGVEKDTRQLVALDENFAITRRYEEFLPPNEHGFDMIWSPDERFVFWRQQIGFDYYSNWVGCRYDLETRMRDIFEGSYFSERIVFTGRRGEFLRIGARGIQGLLSGLIPISMYVEIIDDGRRYGRTIWRVDADLGDLQRGGINERVTTVVYSPDFDSFVIGIPRKEPPYGVDYHMTDGSRKFRGLSHAKSERYESPYSVAALAQDGKTLIGYDDTRLFAIPVEALHMPANENQ